MNIGLLLITTFLSALNVLAKGPEMLPVSATAVSAPVVSFSAKPSASATENIVLSFSGDLIIHEDLYKKVVADKDHDFSKLWKKTFPLLAKANFSYVNLEGPTALGITNKLQNKGDVGFIYDNEVYSGTDLLFNYHPTLIDALQKSGFDIVSTVNNHSMDRGVKGINATIDALIKRNMPFIGTRKSGTEEPLYTLTKIKNFTVAWIGCTEMINGFNDRKSQLFLCYQQREEILKLIARVISEKKPDVVIIIPHWGVEYSPKPQQAQIDLAHEFLDMGATAVIGSHPHVLQPVEQYVTKDKRETFIAYSLGNFVANQRGIERKSSAVIYLQLSKNKLGKTVISDYYYEPTTRFRFDIFPARSDKDVVQHVEQFLGPMRDLKE
ncbi:capsular biosynthesis protein [Bdellovibrio sp. qaytius]|nr:capsular biosynthesis protein [Bdellovibrio sp. qaytius]